MISSNDMAWFAARLAVAVEEVRRLTPTMSVAHLKQALADIPGIETLEVHYLPGGNQKLVVGDKTIEINPMASHDEIRAALQNPFIPTRNTSVSYTGYQPGSILARLKNIRETATAKRTEAMAKLDEAAAKGEQVTQQIEQFAKQIDKEHSDAMAEFAQFSNGGPPLDH